MPVTSTANDTTINNGDKTIAEENVDNDVIAMYMDKSKAGEYYNYMRVFALFIRGEYDCMVSPQSLVLPLAWMSFFISTDTS